MGNRGISLPLCLSLSLFLKAALVPVPASAALELSHQEIPHWWQQYVYKMKR